MTFVLGLLSSLTHPHYHLPLTNFLAVGKVLASGSLGTSTGLTQH